MRRKVAALAGSVWRSVIRHSDHRGGWAAFIHAARGRLWSLWSLASRSERLSFVSRLLDEDEDVGDALVGIHGGNMVGIAPQDHQPRIGNELLVLPRLLERLRFASEMSKASFQRALKAGAKIAFSVNATGARASRKVLITVKRPSSSPTWSSTA